MSDQQSLCPACGKALVPIQTSAGAAKACPACGRVLSAANHSAGPGQTAPAVSVTAIFCPACGTKNQENNFRCANCGQVLHPALPRPVAVPVDDTLGGLIPYKNTSALIAYYLAIFSLLPCVGIPLGIAAVVLGIKGLKFANLHPEAKGRVHAWIGIALGGLCALAYTVLFGIATLSAVHG